MSDWDDEDDLPQKNQRLTWTTREGQYLGSKTGSVDYIDVLVGRLMDTYWDPQGGWSIAYKIEDIK